MNNEERDHETDITIASDGNGTYTVVIGHTSHYRKTWDEVMAIINGKDIDNEKHT